MSTLKQCFKFGSLYALFILFLYILVHFYPDLTPCKPKATSSAAPVNDLWCFFTRYWHEDYPAFLSVCTALLIVPTIFRAPMIRWMTARSSSIEKRSQYIQEQISLSQAEGKKNITDDTIVEIHALEVQSHDILKNFRKHSYNVFLKWTRVLFHIAIIASLVLFFGRANYLSRWTLLFFLPLLLFFSYVWYIRLTYSVEQEICEYKMAILLQNKKDEWHKKCYQKIEKFRAWQNNFHQYLTSPTASKYDKACRKPLKWLYSLTKSFKPLVKSIMWYLFNRKQKAVVKQFRKKYQDYQTSRQNIQKEDIANLKNKLRKP